MSKPKQYIVYSIYFKSNIIKGVDEGLLNNQELYKYTIYKDFPKDCFAKSLLYI